MVPCQVGPGCFEMVPGVRMMIRVVIRMMIRVVIKMMIKVVIRMMIRVVISVVILEYHSPGLCPNVQCSASCRS